MESSKLVLQLGIGLLSVLAVICFISLFERQTNEILGTFFALILRPFWMINDSLQHFWRGVGEFYHGQFSVNGQLDLQHVFYMFIGSLLYSLFFFSFTLSEFHLLALAMSAAGIETGYFNFPIGAGTLTAFALIACFLFWGSIVLDLMGVTNIGPWIDRLDENWRRHLFVIALFSLALSLFVTGAMGLFRGKVVADENINPESYVFSYEGSLNDLKTGSIQSYPPLSEHTSNLTSTGLYYWIPIIANVCIPIVVGIGGVFAGWGIVILLKFLLLMMGFLVICPSGIFLLASSLFVNIADRFYQFIDAIFRLFVAMGNRFMDLFGWNPAESKQPEDPGGDESSEKAEENMRDQSEDQEPPEESEEDTQPTPPEDGWDPFKNKEE